MQTLSENFAKNFGLLPAFAGLGESRVAAVDGLR